MCTPSPLSPSSSAFVSCAVLYYPWWKYNLPLICVPKPYKSKSSKVATFLHRYYVAPPFNQERLITRLLDWHSFVASHLGWGDGEKKQLRDDRKEERERERTRREEITLSSFHWWQQNNVEEGASRESSFTAATGLCRVFLFPSLFLSTSLPTFLFSPRCATSDSSAQVSISVLTPSYLHLQPACNFGLCSLIL